MKPVNEMMAVIAALFAGIVIAALAFEYGMIRECETKGAAQMLLHKSLKCEVTK